MVKAKRNTRATATAVKLAELGFFAPQVVAHRVTRMALAGTSPSARDRKEFTGMVVEKQLAFTQAWLGMFAEGMRLQQQLALSMLTGATPGRHAAQVKRAAARMASTAIAPIHRKAAANAKRLARTKLR
jgi:1-acyl-sn-glycerol-3-phosphate acyltransferase